MDSTHTRLVVLVETKREEGRTQTIPQARVPHCRHIRIRQNCYHLWPLGWRLQLDGVCAEVSQARSVRCRGPDPNSDHELLLVPATIVRCSCIHIDLERQDIEKHRRQKHQRQMR